MIALLAATLASAGCADSDAATSAVDPASSSAHVATSDYISTYPTLPPVPAPPSNTASCTYFPTDNAARPATLPTTDAPSAGTTGITVDTTIGPLTIDLDRAAAPCAVNSFLSLSRQNFYDDTTCHRLSDEPGSQFYQCGDPTGTGTGGPGYVFADEYPRTALAAEGPLPNAVMYPRGAVATIGAGRADTNGSQFFLLIGDSVLSPDYSVFGRLTEDSLAVLDGASAAGHDGSAVIGGGVPTVPLVITSTR